MDKSFKELWREFTKDPTVKNYEQVAIAASRTGAKPRTVVIAAEVQDMGCNLFDPTLSPDYFGSTEQETNHRIFKRAVQLRAGTLDPYSGTKTVGGKAVWSRGFLFTHHNWIGWCEIFKPRGLQGYASNKIGIVIIGDIAGNVIGWHTRFITYETGRTAAAIAENVFAGCVGEKNRDFRTKMRDIFSRRHTRSKQQSWYDVKQLFADIITTMLF